MDLPDRRRPERAAPVHPAARIALVRLRRPVVHVALAAAVVATAAQLGVERVERARVEGAYLDAANQRPDVLRRVAVVGLAGAALPGAQLEVLVQELVHRRARARLALLVDLFEHARAGGLGQLARFGPGGISSTRLCRRPWRGPGRRTPAPATRRSAARRSSRERAGGLAGTVS